MKIAKHLIIIVLLLFGVGCYESNNITGSDDVDEYSGAEFTITEKVVSSSRLTAKGTVKNTSDETYYGKWYVEGDFYADGTYAFKLGGDNYLITYSLAPNESTGWELVFQSSLYEESDYPDFAVKNLRAYHD